MASNYTQNLKLALWAASDPVLRMEFNENNNKLEAAYRQLPRIVSGAYTGDGTCGEENPTTITFNITPYLVVIVADDSINFNPTGIFVRNQTKSPGLRYADSSTAMANLRLTWLETGLSWYSAGDAASARKQLNEEGVLYRYIVVGMP